MTDKETFQSSLDRFIGLNISVLYNFFDHTKSWNEVDSFNDYKHVWQHKTEPKFILAKSEFPDSGEEIVAEIYASEGVYSDYPSSDTKITVNDFLEHVKEIQEEFKK